MQNKYLFPRIAVCYIDIGKVMPKVSIIIPCYNMEKYIERCLDSVQKQLLSDIEIICVDDKSTDNTLSILKSRAEKDSRIRIIEQEKNMGVAVARNTAIDAATGEYIGFVDADDYVDLDYYKKLYNGAIKDEAEISKGLFVVIEPDGRRWITPYSTEAKKRKTLFNYDFQSAIYKKSFLDAHNLRFPVGAVLAEDICFLFKAVYLCNKIHVSDYQTAYFYPLRPDSASNNTVSHKKVESVLTISRELINWGNKIPDMPAIDYTHMIEFIFNTLIKNINKADKLDAMVIEATLINICNQSRNPDESRALMCDNFMKLRWNLPMYYVPGKKILKIMHRYAPDVYKEFTRTILSRREKANGFVKIYFSRVYAYFKLFGFLPLLKKTKDKVKFKVPVNSVKTYPNAPKISIIVPVYNVEKYIDGCMKSLVNQTMGDIEIICVDDCGTDGSMQIVREYAKKDHRVKIVQNKQNGGVPAAYNNGLGHAMGQYIMFCDSDDMFMPDTCETLYNRIIEKNADLAVGAPHITYEADEHLRKIDEQYFAVPYDRTMVAAGPMQELCYPCTWGKIYRRDIIEKYGIKFPVGMKREDEFFFRAYCTWVRKASFISKIVYEYRRRPGSIMNNAGRDKLDLNYIKVAIELFKYLNKYDMFEVQKDWYWGRVFYGFVQSSLRDSSPNNHKHCMAVARKFIRKNYVPYGLSTETQMKIQSLKNTK